VSDKEPVADYGDGAVFTVGSSIGGVPIGPVGTLEEFSLVENMQVPDILLLLFS
jgi:hypothetical protein